MAAPEGGIRTGPLGLGMTVGGPGCAHANTSYELHVPAHMTSSEEQGAGIISVHGPSPLQQV